MTEYAAFILLLGALYTVAGGVVVRGDLVPTPWRNVAFLAIGGILANVVGTTGASMLLIRPFLRMNRDRKQTAHLVVFFIFVVSNLGGLLTPLGDPPLFLGFLNGVPFVWTLRLWPQWLVANGIVLTIFLVWEVRAFRQERGVRDQEPKVSLRIKGWANACLMTAVLAVVLLQSADVGAALGKHFGGRDFTLGPLIASAALLGIGLLSLAITPQGVRKENEFTWGPILEVAILFAGLFVTMVPALALLKHHGAALGLTSPWQFFWLTGLLSSILDNAPTYLAFGAVASGPDSFLVLSENKASLLAAISCGAVFMGANSYVGNGPNFMVKAIADETGVRAPSFFGYMGYAVTILIPTFVVVTLLFFRS